ncbi:hypothetical protein BGX34_003592 [Mortierella sp. NVP85]|nr:hypothetical protein BGX34_003592 [Mortierella sp. NVP85]
MTQGLRELSVLASIMFLETWWMKAPAIKSCQFQGMQLWKSTERKTVRPLFPSEMAVQQVPASNTSHFRLRTESNNTLQEQLYLLQQQMQQVHERMDGILGKIQQTNQQAQQIQQQMQQLQSTQLQMKDEIDTTRQTLQQLDRQTQSPVRKQHLEETQQPDEHSQATQRVGEASQRRTQWTDYICKTNQRVIRWKDIQQRFKDAQFVMNGEDTVLFLTGDDLEDISSGVVLQVAFTDDNCVMDYHQGDSHSVVQLNDRSVASFRIHDADNSRTLVCSQIHPGTVTRLNTSSSQYQEGAWSNLTLQENLHKQQAEEILGEVRPLNQQAQRTHRQMEDQIDKILQKLQQMNQQQIEEVQQLAQPSALDGPQYEVQQRMQQFNQEIQDSRQQLQDIREQAQHQMNEILTMIQGLNQQLQGTRQEHEPLHKRTRNVEKANQEQGPSSSQQRRQEGPHAFDQFLHAQCCVQAVLAKPSHGSPTPRFFVILPVLSAVVEGQEESQRQLRLYFLCECGSHTMAKDSNKTHEVHLAHHPGYDLIDQDEFIKKYGSYLLAMMYMIKFGAKSRGLVVPPLLNLSHVIGEGESIDQLVEETISHLKKATGSINGDTTHQCSDSTGIAELKSHLKIKDGEGFSGGLSRMKIKNEHYSWICNDHLRECYESSLYELRSHINASGGVWHGNEVKVKVTSEETVRMLYNDLSRLFRIQSVENWRPIAGIDLKLDSHRSVSSSTTDILRGFDDPQSLSLDFGRLTMSAKDIFRDAIKDVVISVKDLSALTLDDLEFVQQCCPAAFALSETSQEKNDDRLVSILQRFLSITSLRIECDMKRLMAVIDLVRSTREKLLQGEGRPALHIFELVHPEIKVKVSFRNGYPDLDVETCVKLGNCQPQILDPAVYTFIRRYGWSITNLVVPESFSNRLAKLLDESVQEGGSKMAHLDMTPTSLATPGLDAMSRVINQSQGLTYLRLSLGTLQEENKKEKALLLLGRHKDRLTSLRLVGWHIETWLPQFSRAFPDRDGFPELAEFFLECGSMNALELSSLLKAFGVNSTKPWSKGFETMINAIDLSTLEELHLKFCDFPHEQLKLLVDRITAYGAPSLPLRLLDINGEKLDNCADTHELFVSLREKIPEIKITGIKA